MVATFRWTTSKSYARRCLQDKTFLSGTDQVGRYFCCFVFHALLDSRIST